MNKKLLTIAVGTALAAAPMLAAQADAKFFGHAQVEISSQDSEYNSGDASGTINNAVFDGISVEDRARGRFGFKAKEDLGNGMKGLVHFAWRIDTSDNVADNDGGDTRTMKEREMSVGLQAGWGTVKLGNLKSPYKYTGGVKYDAFVGSSLEARGNGGMTGNDLSRIDNGSGSSPLEGAFGQNNFLANSISYKNKFGNMRVWVAYSPDEGGTASRGFDGNTFASFLYSAGNWEAFVAMGTVSDTRDPGVLSPTTRDQSYDTIKFGGKFKFGGNMTVYAQIEDGTINDETVGGTNDIDIQTVFLGWRMKMGKNTFVVQYGMQTLEGDTGAISFDNGSTCTSGAGNDIDVDMITLGWIHKFTKKTRVFAGYRKTSYDNCTTSAGSGSIADPEDTAISVGLRKDF